MFPSLFLAAVLMTPAAEPVTYGEAYQEAVKTGQPLVVFVTADWCPSCQVMKRQVFPLARVRGLFSRVVFVPVDWDREPVIAKQVAGANAKLPTTVIYRQEGRLWHRRSIVGWQTIDGLDMTLKDVLRLNDAASNKKD